MIPRRLVQTGPSAADALPPSAALRRDHPSFEYVYYDDASCEIFLRRAYGGWVARAFRALRAGAFRADLFRYAYLYAHGGVYVDLDATHVASLDAWVEGGARLVAASERRQIPGVYQGVLAAAPRTPALWRALRATVAHVHARVYPPLDAHEPWTGILAISGPVCLARALGVHAPGEHRLRDGKVVLHRLVDHADRIVHHADHTSALVETKAGGFRSATDYASLVRERRLYAADAPRGWWRRARERVEFERVRVFGPMLSAPVRSPWVASKRPDRRG